jgi:asparaginyl-tRNA synthetase
MIEAEMLSSGEIKNLIKVIEDLMKFIFKSVLKNCQKEINFLEKHFSKEISKDLENFCRKKTPVIEYKHCLEIIESKNKQEKYFFKSGEEIR